MLAEMANKKKPDAPPTIPAELQTELPNFQQQSKMLNPLGVMLYKCTSLKKPEAPLAYTVRSLPWTHAVHFHHIPYEVYENKDGLLVTMAKMKTYETSQISLFQAKIAVEFEKGVFPINMTEFMTKHGFMTPGIGMKVARIEMLKTLDNLIHPVVPAEPEPEPPAEPESVLPKPAAALPLKPVTTPLNGLNAFIDFINANNIIEFDIETMLNDDGKAELEKETFSQLDDAQKQMVTYIRKNKRFLSDAFFTQLPPVVKRVCSYH